MQWEAFVNQIILACFHGISHSAERAARGHREDCGLRIDIRRKAQGTRRKAIGDVGCGIGIEYRAWGIEVGLRFQCSGFRLYPLLFSSLTPES